jgi:RNA polymerase sigma factor (TIGR02999 family)
LGLTTGECYNQPYLPSNPAQEIDNMKSASPQEITHLLVAWSNGDSRALQELMPPVYRELRRLAHGRLGRERPDHTLQTTALVHEAYLRLADQRDASWKNRAQFFAVAAQMMRRVLVDYARARQYTKHGGGAQQVDLDEAMVVWRDRAAEVVALDEALTSLAELDPRKGRVVELRFFGGLSIEETAEILGVSPGTVMRDWTLAKAWLQREMTHGGPDAG